MIYDILKRARDLIEFPANFCQEHYAEDEHGNQMAPSDPKATRFCVLGAVQRAELGIARSQWDGDAIRFFATGEVDQLTNSWDTPITRITDLNNEPKTGHNNALMMLDLAILEAEDLGL